MATARLDAAGVEEIGSRLAENIARAVKAPDRVVRDLIVALLAEGHVLIEDAPGVGKTALARSLARSLEAEYARVQCTSDLLPADLVGTNVFNQREARFDFHPGPVFANVVLVDEINRASPKTQSGLLECMQERQITIDGTKHELARPFLVLATQNPAEFEGTYPLPEAELDRFMVRVALGYPPAGAEAAMLAEHADRDPVEELTPIADATTVRAAQAALAEVHGSEALRGYVVSICDATRADERVELGASPRAGLMLFRASKALAALEGRDHVLPDDVQALAPAVLAHRLLLSYEVDGDQREAVVRDAVARSRRCEMRGPGESGAPRAPATAALGAAFVLAGLGFDLVGALVCGVALLFLAVGAVLWVERRAAGAASSESRDPAGSGRASPIPCTSACAEHCFPHPAGS